jgi:hypothetical protein
MVTEQDLPKPYVFAANCNRYLDRSLLLQSCNRILELLPVYRALGVVLLE